MGFKKTGKKKVKKAPGKKGRKDGWDFEGGTFTEEADKSESKSTDGSKPLEKRGPRKTQERDEYIRRGKAKIEDRKRKWQSEKKMSKKISFNDILNGNFDEVEEETVAEIVVAKKQRQVSSMSVMDRLLGFVNSDLLRASEAKDIDVDVSEEDEEADIGLEEEEEYEMDASTYEDLNGDDEEEEVVEEEEEEEEEEDADIEAESDDNHDDESDSDDESRAKEVQKLSCHDDFEWIFNPPQKPSSIMVKKIDPKNSGSSSYRNNLQKLTAFDDFQVYGALHPVVSSVPRSAIQRYVIYTSMSLSNIFISFLAKLIFE